MSQIIRKFLGCEKTSARILVAVVLLLAVAGVFNFTSIYTALATQNSGWGYGYGYGQDYGYGYGIWTEQLPTLAITYSQDTIYEDNVITFTATFSSAPSDTPDINLDFTGTSNDLSYTPMTGSGATWTYQHTLHSVSADETGTVNIRTIGGSGDTPDPSNNTFTVTNVTSSNNNSGGSAGGTTTTTTTTSTSTVETPITSTGGNITKNNVDGGYARLEVGSNTVSANTTFSVSVTTPAGQGIPAPSAQTGYSMVANQVYSITASSAGVNQTIFGQPLTIRLNYTDAQLGSLDEGKLGIFFWDVQKAKWVGLETTVDKANNTATALTQHLTVFALLGVSSTVDSAKASSEIVQADSAYRPAKPLVTNTVAEKEAVGFYMGLTKSLPEGDRWSTIHFVAYGSPESAKMSLRDRKGVIGDYYEIFGRVPKTDQDWKDVALTLTSHQPTQKSEKVEKQALKEFSKIYKRLPNYSNVNDTWAMNYIGYKIRNVIRNINSEKSAIGTFKSIYKIAPSTSHQWAIMRAIAYSGAKR